MRREQILQVLYEMSMVIGGEVSLQPLLTRTLQRLLYHTSFPAGFVCLELPPAGEVAGDMLDVSLNAVVGDYDLVQMAGDKVSLPVALLYGGAERANDDSGLLAFSCCRERYKAFLRLPIDGCGVIVLLAPRMPASDLPLTQMFQPVMANLAKAIKLCRQYDIHIDELTEEREQARQQLERSQFNLQTLLELSPMGVSFSRDGMLLDANAAYQHMFGYESIDELRAQPVIGHIAPGDRDQFEERVRKRARGEEVPTTYEITGLRRDGTEFPALVSVKRMEMPDGPLTFAFVLDISARKRSEDATRASNELLQSVLEHAPIRVFWKDADLRYRGCNSAFAHDAGLDSPDEVLGKDDFALCWKEQAEHYRTVDLQVMESGKPRLAFEEFQTTPTGALIWLRTSKVPMYDSTGKVTGILGIYDDITRQKQDEAQIRQLAFYDPLTQLPNRRLLADRMQQASSASLRSGRYGALMLLDLDQFKTLNDTEGHSVGDQMLAETAQRLQESVRDGDTVARLGGDEFVVLLEALSTNLNEASIKAEMIAEKIRDKLSEPYWIRDSEHLTTPSIGIAMFRGHQNSQEDLFIHADTAMYQAKARGRNTICFFDPEMQSSIELRSEMEKMLRGALARDELLLYYQMQVDDAGCAIGAEVLLRWQHPAWGMVSPAQFIPVAEESGLIQSIGQWVLESACAQIARWQDDPQFGHLTVAVNVSARQFRQSSFVAQVKSVLDTSGIDPGKLKLELTESLVLDNVEDSISKMTQLRALGVIFSMDDFGTGYSSLTYLKRLPIDQLKIDQSFVRDITTDQSDAAIVQTIIAMARSLELDVIAEGVETEQQIDFLKQRNCHAFQGYFFGRPVPIEEFEQQLRA